jgi:hypothetical protein
MTGRREFGSLCHCVVCMGGMYGGLKLGVLDRVKFWAAVFLDVQNVEHSKV